MRPRSPLLFLLYVTLSQSLKVVSKRGSGRRRPTGPDPGFSVPAGPPKPGLIRLISLLESGPVKACRP
ncbi:unnamed protein product [Merluccius merluccius]